MSADWEERVQGILDPEQVAELRQIPGEERADLFCDVAAIFLRTCPESLERMKEALAAGDLPAVARLAHSIKGSSSNLGAFKLSARSHQIEQEALEGRAELQGLYTEMLGDYAEVEGVLREIVGD